MKTKKLISVVVLFILFFSFKSIVHAQGSSTNAPLFVLQGSVKQKGRPIQGVELVLTKDGKQVAKIITPKNGLYYFQLNKTSADTQSEYLLKINKQGTISGVLRINSYVPKEQFTAIPYLFNLDITFNPESTVSKDFGRISWFIEKNAFDFDKNYIPVPEKDSTITDSVYAQKTTEVKDSNNVNSSAIVTSNKTNDSATLFNTNNLTSNPTDNLTNNGVSKDSQKQNVEKDVANKTFADIINTATSDKNNTANSNLATLDKTKSDKDGNPLTNNNATKSDKLKNDQVLNSSFVKNSESKSSTSSGNSSSVVTSTNKDGNNKSFKNNTSSSTSQNQASSEQQRINNSEKNKATELATNKSENNNTTGTGASNSALTAMSKRDSLAANSSIQKDLFFLTGVPMGQFKTNLPSPNQEIKNAEVYDANEVYSANSERSKYFSEKLRFERKKAENLAKKHETNNTLTSLMNEVDEFDKKNK
jgi:hypothetical protein